MLGGRLSPDSRFLSYVTDQSGKLEVFVRPFDPSAAPGATPVAGPWQVSEQGVVLVGRQDGGTSWRQDGREMYYVDPNQGVMAVEVSTVSTFEFGKPKSLFRAPDQGSARRGQVRVSRDGQSIVMDLHRHLPSADHGVRPSRERSEQAGGSVWSRSGALSGRNESGVLCAVTRARTSGRSTSRQAGARP